MTRPETVSIGEQLLELTLEYREARDARSSHYGDVGTPTGRDPKVIGADFEKLMRELVNKA
ncbi:hypothetical protein [Rhodococcus pyridinivorans]|uniref:hypothetical protein n=1 Tax=Rhodococcus pyridinivorans TaxID=103816 RepID=UPI00265A750F|nr:hypothetical protein [Rhodococcus pyridinivorans]